MGANNSHNAETRRIVIENPSQVQLSHDALNRITTALEHGEHNKPLSSHSTIQSQPQPQQNYDYSGADEYWKQRIDSLKKAHDAINQKMEEEYDKAVSETAQMFKRAQTACITGKLPPCQDQKSSVIKCYKENTSQPLLCAKYVNEFNDCVAVKRSQAMVPSA